MVLDVGQILDVLVVSNLREKNINFIKCQSSWLKPLQFYMIMGVLKTLRQILGFADDVDVLGRAIIEVKEVFVQLDAAATKAG
jgi:hypothetical protein